jgi:hypothetical protein
MAGTDWTNSLPAELGGGTTHIEDVYNALRNAVGRGGSADSETGLEAAWRAAKSQAIAASCDAYERAVWQALPAHATEHVPVYERVLGIAPPSDANEEDRRLAVVAAWTARVLATTTGLQQSLQVISPKLGIEEQAHDLSTVTQLGRMFPSYGDESAHGVPAYPNYSTEFVIRVTYTLDAGETRIPEAVQVGARRYLNTALPAWCDWELVHKSDPEQGLICDGEDVGSVLDVTPMLEA